MPTRRQPYAYELCEHHVQRFTAPRGWQVIRLATNFEPAPPSVDDLYALADLVRQAGKTPAPTDEAPRPSKTKPLRRIESLEWGPFQQRPTSTGRLSKPGRADLRVVRDETSDS